MIPRQFWLLRYEFPKGPNDFTVANSVSEISNATQVLPVIEKSAYDQLLEQANKLSDELERLESLCQNYMQGYDWTQMKDARELIAGWQEFKKSQGL